MFKYAVDGLTLDPSGATPVAAAMAFTPAALICGYGMARAGSTLCNELRNATFAKVCQLLMLFDTWHRFDYAMPAGICQGVPGH